MRSTLSCFLLASAVLFAQTTAWANDASERAKPAVKRFIGCPIYRDTDAGRKSGCWLVSDPTDGVVYDVTPGRLKPILGQEILVEGAVTASDRELCGGTVLEPVDVSVLPTPCKAHLIPAEGYPGRRFVLPAEVLQPSSVRRTLPPPPYEPRTFTVQFELNSEFLVYQYAELIIERASLYAKASAPRAITITGYAATEPTIVSGREIREDVAIARARAEMAALALERLGAPRNLMKLEALGDSAESPSDDLPEAAKRRVEIRIEPSAPDP